MTLDQGGTPSSKNNLYRSDNTLRRQRKRQLSRTIREIFNGVANCGANYINQRKVREIVTVSGQRPRGNFPSRKGKLLKYESLIEESVLRVLEAASCVSTVDTQPCVFTFSSDSGTIRYGLVKWRQILADQIASQRIGKHISPQLSLFDSPKNDYREPQI